MNDHGSQPMKPAPEHVAVPSHAQVMTSKVEHLSLGGNPFLEILELPFELRSCMLVAALDLDPRPTFIVELDQTYMGSEARQSELVFCNVALKACPNLCAVIKAQELEISAAWHSSLAARDQSSRLDSPLILFGFPWAFYTIDGRWRVVSTTFRTESKPETAAPNDQQPSLLSSQSETEHSTLQMTPSLESEAVICQPSFVDVTSGFGGNSIPALSSEFGQRLYNFDWATTYLGPMSAWSQQLLEMFKLMLLDPRPAMLFWGPNNVMLYNEAFVPLMVDRHPSSIGKTVEAVYKNVWEDLHKPLIAKLVETAEAQIHVQTLLCYPKEDDILEEVYADYTSIPVIGVDGRVTGVYQSVVEVTERTLSQRRTITLSTMATISAQARDFTGIWAEIVKGLDVNDKDIPQILLYSLDTQKGEQVTYAKCKLEGSIRWSPISNIDFGIFDLNDQGHILSALFQKCLKSDVPYYLHHCQANHSGGKCAADLSLHLPDFTNGFVPGPFGDPCGGIVTFPIRASLTDEPVGFAIWGLNSRQPYNETYQHFVSLLQQALAASISSALRWEKERLRSQNAVEQAQMDHASLSAQLLHQTKEARTNELRFTRFVQHGPIGICIYAPDGSMAFANEQWYTLTDFPRDGNSTGFTWWTPMIFEEDRAHATEMFTRLLVEQIPVHFEIRLTAPPKQISKVHKQSTWTLVSAYPELSNENELEAVVACFTDITEQKCAAEAERLRTEDAMEAKRQQEAFVDITSHEIRNPLSAVLQSAQEISSLCQELLNTATEDKSDLSVPMEWLKDALHAAEIIEQCTVHQKRIVDDILTLSKMDAGLLPVMAAPAQPVTIVKKTMSFFFRELSQASTEMKFVIDESYKELMLDWLELDAGRLSQMLINLTTNAIKFTKQQPERQIELRIGASLRPKCLETWHLDYLPPSTHKIRTVGFDWPEDECIYLYFSVTDTGTGMTHEDQKTLFARFSQGSARTYTQYGGSGLGLYICRALVEIHGGQIGFSSMADIGSTFGFFIRTRRSSPLQISQKVPIKAPPLEKVSRNVPLDILLVEDNLINQKVLGRQLSRLGHLVTVANHGKECIEILRQSHFCQNSGSRLSIILMDIEMPIMDGMTCATQIRRMEVDGIVKRHVPIVAITGNARGEKVQQAKHAGMDEVVLKPFTLPALMPLIEKLIQRYGS